MSENRKSAMAESHFAGLLRAICLCSILLKGGCVEAADGSCIAAGYTECCNSAETGGPCAGAPPVCYCDPSCKKYNDCCSDLDQICRDPAIDKALNSLKPVITFPASLTFHTASLHWFVLPSANQINVNGSYRILLTEDAAPNSTHHPLVNSNSTSTTPSTPPTFLNFSVEIRNTSASGDSSSMLDYHAGLYGLKQGTRYRAHMIILTNIGSLEDAASTNFTTVKFKYNGKIGLKVKSSSSVQVTWNPLSVPEGISVKHYQVSYGPNEEQRRVEHLYLPEDTVRTLHNLRSDTFYTLDLSAVITETDGSLYSVSLMPPSVSELEVFVPGSSLFQLVTSSTIQGCSDWTAEFEIALKKLFHRSILDLLNLELLNASLLEPIHVQEKQLACDVVVSGNQTVSHTTYRAEVFGTEHVNSNSLVNSIQEWVKRGVVLTSSDNSGKGDLELKVELSTSCPVKIERASVPLCKTEHVQSSHETSERSSSSSSSVSIQVLAISLAAELVVLVVVFVSVSVLVSQLKARRRKWLARNSEDSSSCSNDRTRSHTPSSINNQGNSSFSSGDHPDGSVKVLI